MIFTELIICVRSAKLWVQTAKYSAALCLILGAFDCVCGSLKVTHCRAELLMCACVCMCMYALERYFLYMKGIPPPLRVILGNL